MRAPLSIPALPCWRSAALHRCSPRCSPHPRPKHRSLHSCASTHQCIRGNLQPFILFGQHLGWKVPSHRANHPGSPIASVLLQEPCDHTPRSVRVLGSASTPRPRLNASTALPSPFFPPSPLPSPDAETNKKHLFEMLSFTLFSLRSVYSSLINRVRTEHSISVSLN